MDQKHDTPPHTYTRPCPKGKEDERQVREERWEEGERRTVRKSGQKGRRRSCWCGVSRRRASSKRLLRNDHGVGNTLVTSDLEKRCSGGVTGPEKTEE